MGRVAAEVRGRGIGPRSLLTCARLPELRPVLQTFLQDDMKELIALAEAQASDCLEASWDSGAGGDQASSAVQRAGAGLYLSWLLVAAKSAGD